MSVIDEINRGKEYSRSLERPHSLAHSCSKTKVEPAYTYDKYLYREVFVEKSVVPDYIPNYDECRHMKRNIINRDELNMVQHINLLAQPKIVPNKKVEKPYIEKRKVPGPTPRILELARPNKRRTLETCKRYSATMPQFCIENCHRNIQDVTFVPVHEAVYFIKLKTSKPIIEKRKLKLRMKHLQQKIKEAKVAKMQEMIQKLYSFLKFHLLTPVKDITDQQVVQLSGVIRNKICKMLDRPTELVEDIYLDAFIIHISDKLAVWMNDLLVSKPIIVTEEIATVSQTITATTQTTTTTTQVTSSATQVTSAVTQVTSAVTQVTTHATTTTAQGGIGTTTHGATTNPGTNVVPNP